MGGPCSEGKWMVPSVGIKRPMEGRRQLAGAHVCSYGPRCKFPHICETCCGLHSKVCHQQEVKERDRSLCRPDRVDLAGTISFIVKCCCPCADHATI